MSQNGIRRARIIGTGAALPERVVTNKDLESLVDTSDEWITERTGIKERRIAGENDTLADYSEKAANQALEMAGVDAKDVDMIICGTVTPDWHLPASACFLQARIGAVNASAFDISAGCSGFLYGLSIADKFIRCGDNKTVLVVGAELLSKFINWEDRSTCVIFADGAGAALLQADTSGRGVLGTKMHAMGEMADYISIPAGGTQFPLSEQVLKDKMHKIRMKGGGTFKLAIRSLTNVCKEVLEEAGLEASDVDVFVPHQANKRIIDAVADRLKVDSEKVIMNIETVGNTSAASIPIALDEAVRANRISEGDMVLFAAFGAGLTWASGLVRW